MRTGEMAMMHHTFRTWLKGGEWNFETSSSSPRREDRRGGERSWGPIAASRLPCMEAALL